MSRKPNRRTFFQEVALAASATQVQAEQAAPAREPDIAYPRVFSGRQTKMIAFPLGGVAAGAISLGGRGQLRDWEIFNKPDKGAAPNYAFPSIWAKAGSGKPVARVLEARILPPYEGSSGLGSNNAPGLVRLASSTFTGEYPLARVDFQDRALPVRVSLEAFSPFIPHEPDDSGLPVAILRYRVTNPGAAAAKVSIAWSIDNPCGTGNTRVNEHRQADGIAGPADDESQAGGKGPAAGELCAVPAGCGRRTRVTYLRGWEAGRWWNSPMLFWDDFSADGELGPEPAARNAVGALCLQRTIAPRRDEDVHVSAGVAFSESDAAAVRVVRRRKATRIRVIGNHYCTRFAGAWEAAEYAAKNLERLEKQTRRFAAALAREHDTGRGEGRRIRESFDTGQHDLFPHGRWRVPRLRRG